MIPIVEKIKAPVAAEMKLFEEKFKASMKSDVALLDKITNYIVKRKGKQMRPLFVFLSAKACGEINEATFTAASLIELLHTATLVHDDVVDDANERRGFFSINAIWKNKIAVLVGDFLLSKGMLLCIDNKDYDILDVISESVKQMSEGELLQIEKSKKLDIDEETYFEIIKKKTASLISSCCKIAAISVGSKPNQIKKIARLGLNIGIAFQIKDDLFDYGKRRIGKPRGIDIKQKKLTLPLIYTINNVERREKKWLINSLKKSKKNKALINQIISLVKETGGLDYAIEKMNMYHKLALDELETFDDSSYKKSLKKMINYVIQRNY